MKDFTKPYSLLVISASFFVSTFYSAVLPAKAGNDAKSSNNPTVRVTTGIQQVQGWEQGLVKANPNLARWHWDTIYSYKQGVGRLRPEPIKVINGPTGNKIAGNPGGAAYKYNVPAAQDNRPKHIPYSSKALAEVQARLAQPVQAQHEDNAYGKLTSKQTQAELVPETIATYGKPYQSKETLDTNLKFTSDKASLYGQLLNENHHYNQASKSRKKTRNNKI